MTKIRTVKLNRHIKDFRTDFTIEWDVKFIGINSGITDDAFEYECQTGAFTNTFAQACFDKITKAVKSRRWRIKDWSFAGRSNGWFVLMCEGDNTHITESQIHKMDTIVDSFLGRYCEEIRKFYSQPS
mgnify:FL=1